MSPQYSVYLLDAAFCASATLDIVLFHQCQHHQLQQRIMAWSNAQFPQLGELSHYDFFSTLTSFKRFVAKNDDNIPSAKSRSDTWASYRDSGVLFLLRRLSVLEEAQLILRDQQACILWGDGSVRIILIR